MFKIRDKKRIRLAPAQVIILGFLCVIAIGTLLLTLPAASADGKAVPLSDAAFTAVSATCVTGLVVRDTVTEWTRFGQTVIIIMIQIGGLGFMSLSVLWSMLIRRQITPRERMVVAQSLNLNRYDGTVRFVQRVLGGTLIMEGLGAIIISTQLVPRFGIGEGIYRSIFHSISAFCNAGFDLFGDYSGAYSSVSAFTGNPVVLITLMALIIIGGIGFVVWDDIVEFVRNKRRITVYTKFVLIITAVLLFIGAVAFTALEWNNPQTLGKMSAGNKILNGTFQAVTMRTAGFGTIDNTYLTSGSFMLSILLMFIGGASGSTAGGIKVATFGLIIYSVFRISQGHTEINLFHRRIPMTLFMRAVAITAIGLTCVLVSTVVISSVDGITFGGAVFECVSAFATVGLSQSVTGLLSGVGRIVIMLLMFMGRVGILTITFSIMLRAASKKSCIQYPDTQLMIG